MTDHECTVPFRFARRIGDRWTCPTCALAWDVRSNQFDSVLPFGDYTWFANPANETRISKLFGSLSHRANRFQPEPGAHDRNRLGQLIQELDALGLSHTFALAAYDHNRSADLPYHGAAHGVTVALRAVQAAREAGLYVHQEKAIALAGLFHDAQYVPGDTEARNIGRAVVFAASIVPGDVAPDVARLIRSTTFPHSAPQGEDEAILQDADVMQCFEPDRLRWLDALAIERSGPVDDDFPPLEMLNTDAAKRRPRN